ncbi:MAG TPA: class I SAM-dependent methyltransferase [Streptosporangiaceae bacterium]|jgi:SAM-dependent methyltransferase
MTAASATAASGTAAPEPVGRDALAGTFADADVVAAYRSRPPYPAEVFDVLASLICGQPRDVLDIGAGDGALARPLAAIADHIDAVDISAAMLRAGARQPGGQRPNLRWILGAIETAELSGPYALVTAGASLHWMDPEVTMARLAQVMMSGAVLAVVEHGPEGTPWGDDVAAVIRRHSRSPDYVPALSWPDKLAGLGLLRITGRATTVPVVFRQSLAQFVEHLHSTSALARKWMTRDEAAAFRAGVIAAVGPHADNGELAMPVVARITWGTPSASPDGARDD